MFSRSTAIAPIVCAGDLSHGSREAAQNAWIAFREGAQWVRIAGRSQVDGRVVEIVNSAFMRVKEFSRLR
jgi:hypothetical protein